MTPAQQVQKLFAPLLGQLVWGVRCGHGSFLNLEFGQPHVVVQDPITASAEHSERVRRNLRRRRVFIVGDWHLLIQYCDWRISVADGSVDSQSSDFSLNERLFDLDGQRFLSVASSSQPNSWKFEFDLGGSLKVRPSNEYKPADDMWTLHAWNAEVGDLRTIAALRNDGGVAFEKAAGLAV